MQARSDDGIFTPIVGEEECQACPMSYPSPHYCNLNTYIIIFTVMVGYIHEYHTLLTMLPVEAGIYLGIVHASISYRRQSYHTIGAIVSIAVCLTPYV